MLLGRFMMILPMLAIAGNLAGKKHVSGNGSELFPVTGTSIHSAAHRRGRNRGRTYIFPGSEPGANS